MASSLSVITITYNAADCIIPTLKSVAAQLYPHIEHIIVDGASQDETLSLVAQYSPSALVKSEPDHGLYDAMNKGLQRATGEYVCFLNAGDTFASSLTVTHIMEAIEGATRPPDVLYGDTAIVDGAGNRLGLRRLRPPKQLRAAHFLQGMLVCHQAFIVRRALAPPYDLRYQLSADYDWCLRILRATDCTEQLEEVLVNYLAGGLTEKRHLRSLWERFLIMGRHFGFLRAIWQHFTFIFVRKR